VQFGAGTDVQAVTDLLLRTESVEEQADYAQLKRQVASALAALPPRQRIVIVQRYFLQMSEKEMAESLSAAPGTVKWLLNAARESLRGLLRSERSAK
jgi:RNA polymerase sigma-70 factor (ECF subfamily)